MHSRSLDHWTHEHVFLGVGHARNEKRSWLVVGLRGTMMVAEIIGGIVFGSMAFLADGWHMSTHAAALVSPIATHAITPPLRALRSGQASLATSPPSPARVRGVRTS
jgi:Co/Zn/Cd efflux system component